MEISLTLRQREILKAIVNDYIQKAEPIGSRTLSKYYFLDLSPATIRNEMAELEERGLLKQPHISSGRIPSDSGYRLFVDQLMDKISVSSEEKCQIIEYLETQKNLTSSVELILNQAAQILSVLSKCVAMVQLPQINYNFVKYVQIMPISSKEIIAFISASNGLFYHYNIRLSQPINADSLELLNNYLNEKLKGVPLDEIDNVLMAPMEREIQIYIDFIHELHDSLSDLLSLGNRLFMDGTSNILKEPEFQDINKIYSFINFCEQKGQINDLLKVWPELGEIIIYIGNENKQVPLNECSVVFTSYALGDKAIGKLGVLGATRMNYAKVKATVNAVAEELSQTLTQLFG